MSDIMERLTWLSETTGAFNAKIASDARDEIKRLRNALRDAKAEERERCAEEVGLHCEEMAKAMFEQHHGEATARGRPWESVREGERIYWRAKVVVSMNIAAKAIREQTDD